MRSIILNEGVLNDDMLYVADEGKGFGWSKYPYFVEYYIPVNEWCNREHQFGARTLDGALKRYEKLTGRKVNEMVEFEI